MITQVLPNNNLVIQGQKKLSLSEGSETIRLSGIISSRDIQPDNTVLSSRIAGAQIAYQGTGDLADFSKVNWGTQLLTKYGRSNENNPYTFSTVQRFDGIHDFGTRCFTG